MITLAFASGVAYLKPTVVAARSALANMDVDAEVIVLGADLDGDAVEFLESRITTEVTVTPIPPDLLARLPILERLPPTTWSRLFLGSLLPDRCQRVLSLDSDLLVRRPIDDLATMSLAGMTVAASVDYWEPTHADAAAGFWQAAGTPPGAAYFNGGMLVVDLERWRETGVEDDVRSLIERTPSIPVPNADQDIMNAALWNRWLPISRRWNYPAQLVAGDSYQAHIAHFFGRRKPWVVPCENRHFQREYREAAREIGWEVPGPSRDVRHVSRLLAPQFAKDLRDRRRARREV